MSKHLEVWLNKDIEHRVDCITGFESNEEHWSIGVDLTNRMEPYVKKSAYDEMKQLCEEMLVILFELEGYLDGKELVFLEKARKVLKDE